MLISHTHRRLNVGRTVHHHFPCKLRTLDIPAGRVSVYVMPSVCWMLAQCHNIVFKRHLQQALSQINAVFVL